MNTSPVTTMLSKPTGSNPIPIQILWYFQGRNRLHLYSLVVSEFKKSGISQADLARRLGKKPDRVCKMLAAPGNWTSNTASDLLFAISGAEIQYSVSYPLDNAPRNATRPEWLDAPQIQSLSGTSIKVSVPTSDTFDFLVKTASSSVMVG
jgi:hypothetical protein